MAQTISPSAKAAFRAMAASVDTPTAGLSTEKARPLAAETPMRMPVKEPGPTATAMASISDSFKSVFFRMCSTMGIKVRLWVRPVS